MKLYPDSKVFILCPSNKATGGPTSLHQLCSQLLQLGIKAYMRYNTKNDDPVHEFYKKYHLPYVFELEDEPHNIVIVPESYPATLDKIKNIQVVIWWLSVYHYVNKVKSYIQSWLNEPLAKPKPRFFFFEKVDENVEHWTQSEYTRQFLLLNGITNFKDVETPMSNAFLSRADKIDFSAKKDFVAYNPKKGLEVTKLLMELAPDINWRPIKNMTPQQVQELLARAKVYIDFGSFPGRERLPREASISGCVIITGKRGAAANDVDICIPSEFKFDNKDLDPKQVIEKIREIFEHYEAAFQKQKDFRDKELHAKKIFINALVEFFGINETWDGEVALAQSFSGESFLAFEKMQGESIKPSFIIDDMMVTKEAALFANKFNNNVIVREQNRNYLRVGDNLIEIITRDDAKFLYHEGRIKKFALLEPDAAELDELKRFYETNDNDILIFDLEEREA